MSIVGTSPLAECTSVEGGSPAETVEPTVLATWTETVLRALAASGVDAEALARRAGIDPAVCDVEGARLPLSQTTRLWHLAVEATGDPAFGIQAARYVRPRTFRGLSLAILSSATFGEALDRVVRFAPVVMNPAVRATCAERDGHWEVSLVLAPDGPEPAHESVEAIFACLVRTARFLVGCGSSPLRVDLRRPAGPRATSEPFERFFRCPIRFGSDRYRMVFGADLVNERVLTGHGDVARSADQVVRTYLADLQCAGGVTDQVREALAVLLLEGEPSSSAVARRLAVSCRTMQRRLQEEGVTFRDLLAEVRIRLAKQMISVEGLPVHHVADRLGFSDTASFRRSFKRLTGMTPGDFTAQFGSAIRSA
jgi:AraC-like DNA-binding protein